MSRSRSLLHNNMVKINKEDLELRKRIEKDLRNRIAIHLLGLGSTQASILYRDQNYCKNET